MHKITRKYIKKHWNYMFCLPIFRVFYTSFNFCVNFYLEKNKKDTKFAL